MKNSFELIKEIEQYLGDTATVEKVWEIAKGVTFYDHEDGYAEYEVSNFDSLKNYYRGRIKDNNYTEEGINYFLFGTVIKIRIRISTDNFRVRKTRDLCFLEIQSLEKYEITPVISAWYCSTDSDEGQIYWIEQDDLILYTPETEKHIENPTIICNKVEIVEDNEKFTRNVIFTRLDGTQFIGSAVKIINI